MSAWNGGRVCRRAAAYAKQAAGTPSEPHGEEAHGHECTFLIQPLILTLAPFFGLDALCVSRIRPSHPHT